MCCTCTRTCTLGAQLITSAGYTPNADSHNNDLAVPGTRQQRPRACRARYQRGDLAAVCRCWPQYAEVRLTFACAACLRPVNLPWASDPGALYAQAAPDERGPALWRLAGGAWGHCDSVPRVQGAAARCPAQARLLASVPCMPRIVPACRGFDAAQSWQGDLTFCVKRRALLQVEAGSGTARHTRTAKWTCLRSRQSLVAFSLQDHRGGDRSAGARGAPWVGARRRRSRRRAAQQVAGGGGGRADAAAADTGDRAEHRRRRGARPPLVLHSCTPSRFYAHRRSQTCCTRAAAGSVLSTLKLHTLKQRLCSTLLPQEGRGNAPSLSAHSNRVHRAQHAQGRVPSRGCPSHRPPPRPREQAAAPRAHRPACGARWSLRAARSRAPRQPAAAPRPAPGRAARASAHLAPAHAAPLAATRRTPASG